jgi:regulatory protein
MGRTREPKNPKSCHERALGLLAVRSRSRREMEVRLLRAGFGSDEVETELATLERVRLLDDAQFAHDLAAQAFGSKKAGTRAVRSALAAKGVASTTIEAVCAEFSGSDEQRADELACARATRMGDLDPKTAYRRLTSFLIRRGHAPSVAYAAAGRALGRGGSED